jgi:hypothetical protein
MLEPVFEKLKEQIRSPEATYKEGENWKYFLITPPAGRWDAFRRAVQQEAIKYD